MYRCIKFWWSLCDQSAHDEINAKNRCSLNSCTHYSSDIGLSFNRLLHFVYARGEGSGKIVRMRILVEAFAARGCDTYQCQEHDNLLLIAYAKHPSLNGQANVSNGARVLHFL